MGYSGSMVFGHGGPNPGEGIDEYYASMQPQWAGIDTVRWVQMTLLDRLHLLICPDFIVTLR